MVKDVNMNPTLKHNIHLSFWILPSTWMWIPINCGSNENWPSASNFSAKIANERHWDTLEYNFCWWKKYEIIIPKKQTHWNTRNWIMMVTLRKVIVISIGNIVPHVRCQIGIYIWITKIGWKAQTKNKTSDCTKPSFFWHTTESIEKHFFIW